jgi:hypothetical protein
MPKHNPKLNACPPIQELMSLTKNADPARRTAAAVLIDAQVKPRHIRKALNLSGRQFRKAQREAKASRFNPSAA